jgi:hypothetical protein
MAGIDDRAADLNKRLADMDDEEEDQADDDQDDEGQADGEDDGEEEPQEEAPAQPARPGADSGPALSAGIVLGFIAYSCIVQVFRGGPAQLKGWLKAKMINEPWSPAVAAEGG